jgi:hypothetical protein
MPNRNIRELFLPFASKVPTTRIVNYHHNLRSVSAKLTAPDRSPQRTIRHAGETSLDRGATARGQISASPLTPSRSNGSRPRSVFGVPCLRWGLTQNSGVSRRSTSIPSLQSKRLRIPQKVIIYQHHFQRPRALENSTPGSSGPGRTW